MVDTKKLLQRTARLGVEEPEDLLFLMPKDIDDYSVIHKLNEVPVDEYGFFKLIACSYPKSWQSNNNQKSSGFTLLTKDNTSSASMIVNGIAYEISKVKAGEVFYCRAKVGVWNGNLQLSNVEWIPQNKLGKVFARYKSIPKVIRTDKISEKVKIAYDNFLDKAIEKVIKACHAHSEHEVISKSGIPFDSLASFFTCLHYPANREDLEKAKESAKKLGILEIISYATDKEEVFIEESFIDIQLEDIKRLISRIPFPLTDDQEISIYDIVNDLRLMSPMNRMLSGDVGTGKTLTYMIPAVAAYKQGKKVAIMVQSFLVASQVASEIRQTFPEVDVIFKAGKLKKKEEQELENKLKTSNAIVVGTSGVINALQKHQYHLDFLIVDEQHKMGKEQREQLKKNHTNYLEATATPIPRTMAIVTHGGMSISFLKTKPVYKNIKTVIWDESRQKELIKEIRYIIDNNFQCALIYPVVDEKDEVISENEEEDEEDKSTVPQERNRVKHAVKAAEMMEKIFPNNVALLHGKMKDSEKNSVLKELKENKKQVLIASSVIEIGVTLPSMMMVAVIDPDVHGVTSLHQLRGRVDRNGNITKQGLVPRFILFVRRNMTEKISDRLNILVQNDDGFLVAEEDMNQRGFGEMSGSRQSGSTSSVFIDLKFTPLDITNFIETMNVSGEDNELYS